MPRWRRGSKAMSELQIIESTLLRAARRRRWQRALNGLGLGLLAGAGVFLLALATYKLLPIPPWIVPAAALLALGLTLAGFVRGAWPKVSLLETARWVDQRNDLKERLSTALEMAGARPDDWQRLLLADAAKHAQPLN